MVSPRQEVINHHLGRVIEVSSEKHRRTARNNSIELVAAENLGRLLLPCTCISEEVRGVLLTELRGCLREDRFGAMTSETLSAFINQFRVPLLLSRATSPLWHNRVRSVMTPDGVEDYRQRFRSNLPSED